MLENDFVAHFTNRPVRALPELGKGEVHIFRLWAREGAAQYAYAMNLLSPRERDRAAQYRVEGAREEFVVGRAALRVLVGAVVGVEPGCVDLGIDRNGKPFARGIEFNVTHSRGLVYLALCRDGPVGVDVEWIDPALEVLELAEPNFTAEETHSLTLLPDGAERAAAFCRLWTQKEAVAKADGRGLSIALRDIVLPSRLPGVARVATQERKDRSAEESDVTRQELPRESIRYSLEELDAPEGFSAALAVRESISPIVCRFFLLDLLSSGVS